MSGTVYNEDHLPDLLPLYYKRIFPQVVLHKWLCYGVPSTFAKREISFTLIGDIYIRYQSFKTVEEFGQTLHKKFPVKMDIGAIYNQCPNLKSIVKVLAPVEKELIFDIDMTDYDEVRTCCSGADVCVKCWKFMAIACKVIDAALREDFGFKNILWVFSGRRGIHCWVADKAARILEDNGRSAIAEYLQVIKGGLSIRKVQISSNNIHHALNRSLKIIDEYFEEAILGEQDILGTPARLKGFLNNIDLSIRPSFTEAMENLQSSQERWNAFQNTFQKLLREQKHLKGQKFMVEEFKLYYSYPRLDINVTNSIGHLLKAPFCVHPKTGKISVPFDPKYVDHFDPSCVPTISQVVDEINMYDAQTKQQEQSLQDGEVKSNVKIEDYKKTSLLKYVNIFKEFLSGLRSSAPEMKESMEY